MPEDVRHFFLYLADMKKISLLFMSFIIVMTTHAQILIPKAGITLSKIQAEVSQGMKSKLGFTIGLAYNHPINEILSLQPELSFVQKGYLQDYSQNEDGFSIDSKGKFTVSYLEIPLLAKASFDVGSDIKIYMNAGPAIGIGLGGKYEADYTFSFMGDTDSISLDGKIKFGDSDDSDEETLYLDNQLEFGLQVGCGIMVTDKIMIDLRYGHSLSSMTDESDDAVETRNRVVQLTFGYPIRFK
jgi:opacity protein-like surface antigen